MPVRFNPQTDFDPVLNPGKPRTAAETLPDEKPDSFDALWKAFQRKHELSRTRFQIEQDSQIGPEDKTSLLQDLEAFEAMSRRELITFLHRNNCRQEIEGLIAQPGHPALYFPEDNFYIDRVEGGVHFLD